MSEKGRHSQKSALQVSYIVYVVASWLFENLYKKCANVPKSCAQEHHSDFGGGGGDFRRTRVLSGSSVILVYTKKSLSNISKSQLAIRFTALLLCNIAMKLNFEDFIQQRRLRALGLDRPIDEVLFFASSRVLFLFEWGISFVFRWVDGVSLSCIPSRLFTLAHSLALTHSLTLFHARARCTHSLSHPFLALPCLCYICVTYVCMCEHACVLLSATWLNLLLLALPPSPTVAPPPNTQSNARIPSLFLSDTHTHTHIPTQTHIHTNTHKHTLTHTHTSSRR